jgi:hypothetical protein
MTSSRDPERHSTATATMIPAELLLLIATSPVLTPHDLTRLSRVNHWFHHAVLPLLYAHPTLVLNDPRTAAALGGLAENPDRAALVRSLTLKAPHDYDEGECAVDGEMDRRLAKAVRSMNGLRRFHWAVPGGMLGEETIKALWERREKVWCGLVGEQAERSWVIRRLLGG